MDDMGLMLANVSSLGNGNSRRALSLGLPKVFDESVICIAYRTSSMTISSLSANIKWAQG
jgi:hypothetical protein